MAIALLATAVITSVSANARPASSYAESSALSSGKWVKIKVSQSGMQYIGDAHIKALGFSDPTKVKVYGYGGRMISETLDDSHPDDLPTVPSVRTSDGLLFFGVDNWLWQPSSSANKYYAHTMHPYALESYYFLSDIDADSKAIPPLDLTDVSGLQTAYSFIERLVHEQDIFAPSVTGRNLLGEDLRSAVQLNFALPGNIGGDASIKIQVGTNISGGSGTIRLTSTNSSLIKNSINVSAVNSSEQFMRVTSETIFTDKCGEALNLGLTFSTAGVINLARLDYVEVEYERALTLPSDQLYFYFNEETAVGASLEGVTEETEIWDVTIAHAPKKVTFSRSGSTARFRVEEGYREFVAFNPSKVARAVESAGNVSNQDLHGLESPDMLIITPEEYKAAAEKIADLHRSQDAMTVHVVTPEVIYNEFSSGTPDLSAFRKLMKMWYDRDMQSETGEQKIRYCLIMSRPTYDNKMVTPTVKNAGYPRVPIWQSPTGYTENTSYSTDDFIGMLEDGASAATMSTAKINVAVGRFPVRSLEEALTAAEKLINYTINPEKTSWRNNVMLLADDQDNGQHLDQTEKMYANLIASEKGKGYQYERLYLDNFQLQLTSVGLEYPEAKKRLLSKFEEGQALITYVGHANTVSWTHEHLLNWGDITSFSNTRLPVLYAATCEFARWDTDEYSGAEVMWAFPKTGLIATICPSRSVFINMNGPLSAQFGKYALINNADGTPTRLGDSYVNMKNGILGTDDNKLRYAMIGDPAMRMPVFTYSVEATAIADVDVNQSEAELPTIEARANPVVKGVIRDAEGNVATDFNGSIFIKLYDAEKVIETNGNGDDGKVMLYNDRKTKLYDGAAKVVNGEWETTILMPSEIENNFTPGRMTYYALADDGREANGATEQFYVYGYNENAPEDLIGPSIHKFVLNHDNFHNGDISYKTPVVFAEFSDESGINISDAGIGHALMLNLDGKTFFTDIINFYTPDPEDNTKGSFAYQLPEIEPGEHNLTLSVWDCANNSSYATLSFNVAAVKAPAIYDFDAQINADRDGVEFVVMSDRPLASLDCHLEVFDINGVRVWHNLTSDRTDSQSAVRVKWDYTSGAGYRVSKGIYLCRATVTTPEGKTAKKSKKIIVSY